MPLPERFCLNHTDTPAATNCVQCHKPICSSCIVEAQGKAFCSNACGAKYAHFYSSYTPDAPERWKTLKLLVKLAAAAALVVVGLMIGRHFGVGICAQALKYIGL